MATQNAEDQASILKWFRLNQRPLPWRENREPYKIWISETMLQQTTTTAVIPFYERFLKLFPDLKSLANADENLVVEAWAGLGYYSRARNLRKAAEQIYKSGGFPRSYIQLQEFPGIGPYTSRAVSSLAFGESVGVVDGNVIRVLSRFHKKAWKWWESQSRTEIQTRVDQWVKNVPSNEMNQALMELGATICTPKSPSCMLCPLQKKCGAFRGQSTQKLPLGKPRRAREIWHWQAQVMKKGGRILLVRNNSVPFLKGQWLLPGSAQQIKVKPKRYDYRHSITHHDIFVTISTKISTIKAKESKWVVTHDVAKYIPASLVQKALRAYELRLVAESQLQAPKSIAKRRTRDSRG